MSLRLRLIPEWRHAWKWLSVQAAFVLVLLGAIQLAAQQFEGDSAFAVMTHSSWWLIAKTLIAAAIPLLRLVHQPVAVDVASDAPQAAPDSTIPVAIAAGPVFNPSTSDAMQRSFAELIEQHFSPPKGPPMTTNISKILNAIPGLVVQAEQAFKGTPGSGADKAAAVTGIVAATLPAGDSAGMQKAQAIMMMAVAFFNTFHPDFQKTAPAAPAAGPLAQTAGAAG